MVFSVPTVLFSLLSYLLPLNRHQAPLDDLYIHEAHQKSIAIIGAGSAGLAVLKTALDISEQDNLDWKVVLFEEREDVGGIWYAFFYYIHHHVPTATNNASLLLPAVWRNYRFPDSRNLTPPDLPETPLYPRLRTNTPIPTMTYPNFVFPPGTPLYPRHEHILEYHRAYAKHFHLRPYIRFNHSVLSTEWHSDHVGVMPELGSTTLEHGAIAWRKNGWRGRVREAKRRTTTFTRPEPRGRWNVTFVDTVGGGGDVRSEFFDHLVVASGNHHIPKIIHWRGEDEWLAHASLDQLHKREIMHAIWYRNPEEFTGKTLLIVGAGASGRDIAGQVVDYAERTYISVRHPVDSIPGTELVAEISHFSNEGIHLFDGTILRNVDTVVLGTGYQIRKPFLEKAGLVKVDPHAKSSSFRSSEHLTTNVNYLFPLYKHIFPVLEDLPVTALAFVGIPMGISNCPSDLAQSLYVLHLMKHGDDVLPQKDDLLRELDEQEEEVRQKGLDPYVLGHRLVSGTQSDYQDDLVEFLKEKVRLLTFLGEEVYPSGLIRDDRRRYVELWRRDALEYDYLRRGWFRIEELGLSEQWLKGVETEEQWAILMKRVNEWQRDWESKNNITFSIDEFLV
ncbi:FAD/NAD(P)-binding domain-containing protein [Macrolepiota fuliginosa MF-IS2]|uniref:FAD/NAD(P)-binding domain-containing protein n=1 Tax=Macrolepiota fuliginosa MF-IS2 TaxID=1400762 RepID=A0A9P5XPC3_9AGAR|nr:FAD/NAD(P)-binding domain-containing protein [Macrolepiota fuliginosa MF-IS2]